MFFEDSLANAKFHRTLLVDDVGFGYVVAPAYRSADGSTVQPETLYQNKYWAEYLLRNHCSFWAGDFDLLTLYQQLCPTPLQHHKSTDDMIDELSNRMAGGELQVYKVHNFLPPPPDSTGADVPMAGKNKEEPNDRPTSRTKALTQGGKADNAAQTLEAFDLSCTLPDGTPATGLPYKVTLLSSGATFEGKLDNTGTQHYDNLEPGDVEVTFGKPISESDIQATRTQISQVLDSIIAAQKAQTAELDAEYQQMNVLEKGAKLASEAGKGLYDAGAGLLEFIGDLSYATSIKGQVFQAAAAAWQTYNTTTDDWLGTFNTKYDDMSHHALVEALGFDPESINKETIAEAYEIASFVKNDPATQAALFNFAKEFAKTQHEQEWAYIGGGALFEIALAALLAAATGGLDAAGAAARRALYIDKFAELGQLLKTLTRQLKQKAQYKVKRGQTNGAVEHQITRPDGAEVPTEIKSKPKTIESRKGIPPTSLQDAKERLLSMAKVIENEGYHPKYTDDELIAMAKAGTVEKERFHIRFMEKGYINGGEGLLGAPMEGVSGKGAKYWSTTFDQIEDADTDFELIAQKLGLGDSYSPEKEYTLIIIDTEKAKDLTGVKSVSATFENLSKFANNELPDEFPKEVTDVIMNSDFQNEYAKHYSAANSSGYLEWYSDPIGFNNYLSDTKLDKDTKDSLLRRILMQKDIGNNKDYTGNGLTMDQIENSSNIYGAVETFNFERKLINLNQLQKSKAITYIAK